MSANPTIDGSGKPILIVGAGPTGLVLAIELARRGVAFHLIDRMERPAPWSACIFIKPRSLEILASLGLVEAFLERGQIIDGIDVYLNETKAGQTRFSDLDTPYPYILSVPEVETVELLTDKLQALSGHVERGVELVGLEQQDGSVLARLNSRDRGDHVRTCQWVVGADGYHSTVRDAISDRFDGKDYPELWGVVDTHIGNWRHPRNRTCVQFEPPIVLPFPLGEDRWRVYFRSETQDKSALERVNERLAVLSPGAALVDPEKPQFFTSHSRIARAFRMGRVLLAGDAAHGSNPIEGHGMNAGMQDAFNLGWKLAIAASGTESEDLIASYEAERAPVDRVIVQSGDAAYARLDPANAEGRRQLAEKLATREGRYQAALASSEIGLTYEPGPLVEEFGDQPSSSTHNTEIGARLGEVTGLIGAAGPTTLHALIGDDRPRLFVVPETARPAAIADARGWVAELAAPAGQEPLQALIVLRDQPPKSSAEKGLLYDPTGLLHERLGGAQPCLCLVRPDGHLGFRSSPPDPAALGNYLKRIYGSG